MPTWNGQNLSGSQPVTLGFTLDSAHLIPGFVEQALASGLFANTQDTQITPLDDVKEWMRSDPYREGDLFGEVGEVLLAAERQARKTAEKAGVEFDAVGFELAQMEEDETFESFTAEWAGLILKLALEDADALQAWSRREHGMDLALAASFQLADPRKNPVLSREAIAAALLTHGNVAAAKALHEGRAPKMEMSGAFQLDLGAKDAAGPNLTRHNGVGFVRVLLADPRAGDDTFAWLSLAYPLEAEGYFLLTFDALRQHLALKGEDA